MFFGRLISAKGIVYYAALAGSVITVLSNLDNLLAASKYAHAIVSKWNELIRSAFQAAVPFQVSALDINAVLFATFFFTIAVRTAATSNMEARRKDWSLFIALVAIISATFYSKVEIAHEEASSHAELRRLFVDLNGERASTSMLTIGVIARIEIAALDFIMALDPNQVCAMSFRKGHAQFLDSDDELKKLGQHEPASDEFVLRLQQLSETYWLDPRNRTGATCAMAHAKTRETIRLVLPIALTLIGVVALVLLADLILRHVIAKAFNICGMNDYLLTTVLVTSIVLTLAFAHEGLEQALSNVSGKN